MHSGLTGYDHITDLFKGFCFISETPLFSVTHFASLNTMGQGQAKVQAERVSRTPVVGFGGLCNTPLILPFLLSGTIFGVRVLIYRLPSNVSPVSLLGAGLPRQEEGPWCGGPMSATLRKWCERNRRIPDAMRLMEQSWAPSAYCPWHVTYSHNQLDENMPCSRQWGLLSYIFTRVFYICGDYFIKLINCHKYFLPVYIWPDCMSSSLWLHRKLFIFAN